MSAGLAVTMRLHHPFGEGDVLRFHRRDASYSFASATPICALCATLNLTAENTEVNG
jgi:hypothetical protein